MQRIVGTIIILFVFGVAVTACDSETVLTPVHTPVFSPTTPETIASPGPETPTSFQPSPSAIPSPTQTEAGLLFSYESISAPITPDSPASAYRLANWTEEEWLVAIAEARTFATELTENWGSNDFIYGYYGLRRHLMLMEKEVLLRYPDTPAYSGYLPFSRVNIR